MPWSELHRRRYRKRVEDARRAIRLKEAGQVRDLYNAVLAHRQRLISELLQFVPPPGEPYWREWQLPQLIQRSDAILEEMGAKYGDILTVGQRTARDEGTEAVRSIISAYEPGNWSGLTPDLHRLEIIESMGLDYITAVSKQMRGRIRQSLIGGISAQKSPWEIMKEIGGTKSGFLKRPSIMRSTFYQAETIVRTEMGRVYSASQQTTLENAAPLVDGLQKQWDAAEDGRTRPAHAAANGQIVDVDKPFIVGGENLMYPRDPGGSAGNTINCLVPGQEVQGAFVSALKAEYTGDVIEIETRFGDMLTVTPNHPVLTEEGFVPAGEILQGNNLVCYRSGFKETLNPVSTSTVTQNEQNAPAFIDQVFRAFDKTFPSRTVPPTSDDLHGDARSVKGEIEVVNPYGELLFNLYRSGTKGVGKFLLEKKHTVQAEVIGFRGLGALCDRSLSATSGNPRRRALALYCFTIMLQALPLHRFSFGSAAQLDAVIEKALMKCGTANAEFVRQLLKRCSVGVTFGDFDDVQIRSGMGMSNNSHARVGKVSTNDPLINAEILREAPDRRTGTVTLDKVINVRKRDFSGHVYDLQSRTGVMVAQNIFISNCRCTHNAYKEDWG